MDDAPLYTAIGGVVAMLCLWAFKAIPEILISREIRSRAKRDRIAWAGHRLAQVHMDRAQSIVGRDYLTVAAVTETLDILDACGQIELSESPEFRGDGGERQRIFTEAYQREMERAMSLLPTTLTLRALSHDELRQPGAVQLQPEQRAQERRLRRR